MRKFKQKIKSQHIMETEFQLTYFLNNFIILKLLISAFDADHIIRIPSFDFQGTDCDYS